MCDDFFDDFGWENLGLSLALGETIAEEEKERLRLEQEAEADEKRCCCDDHDPFNPPDEDPFP